MAKRKFTTDLSIKGIQNLQKQLLNYKDNILQHRVDLFAKTLAERGVEIAQVNVARMDAIFTGELISSIHTRYGGSTKRAATFFIVADSEHAVYVEFGTGQLGEEGGYPYPFPEGINWDYNSGEQIIQLSTGEYGWFYPMDDGTWRFTQGMPSRPFMYETSLELMQSVVKIAKEIFR